MMQTVSETLGTTRSHDAVRRQPCHDPCRAFIRSDTHASTAESVRPDDPCWKQSLISVWKPRDRISSTADAPERAATGARITAMSTSWLQ